jgi:hypothetical protein
MTEHSQNSVYQLPGSWYAHDKPQARTRQDAVFGRALTSIILIGTFSGNYGGSRIVVAVGTIITDRPLTNPYVRVYACGSIFRAELVDAAFGAVRSRELRMNCHAASVACSRPPAGALLALRTDRKVSIPIDLERTQIIATLQLATMPFLLHWADKAIPCFLLLSSTIWLPTFRVRAAALAMHSLLRKPSNPLGWDRSSERSSRIPPGFLPPEHRDCLGRQQPPNVIAHFAVDAIYVDTTCCSMSVSRSSSV